MRLTFSSNFTNRSWASQNFIRRFYIRKRVQAAFDAEFYRLLQPALENSSKRELYKHYVEKGWKDNLDPNAEFSVSAYRSNNRDVRDAGIEPLFHYIAVGQHEKRPAFLSLWGNFAAVRLETYHLDKAIAQNNLARIRKQLPCEIARLSDRAVMSFALVLGNKLNLSDLT